MLPAIADHYPKAQNMQGRPHGFINNDEMMDFYKNQMNRVNGNIPLPGNDYNSNIMPGGGGGILSRLQQPSQGMMRNYAYNQSHSV